MSPGKLLIIAICLVPGIIAFVELFLRLPFFKHLHYLKSDSTKALSVISSSNISDHWKEKVIPRYARNILSSSLIILLYMVMLLITFSAVYCLSGFLFFKDITVVIATLYRVDMQIIAVFIGMLYGFMRVRIRAATTRNKGDYTLFSKILHHIALNSSVIKEVAFDIDCMTTRLHKDPLQSSSPVFVSGLARAGTTILLEAIYSTGVFTTLTYRDMPFVTAPYLWRMITKGQRRKSELKERAHSDGLYVNYDSPEAFEEVFWKTFSEETYIKESYQELQNVDFRLAEKYRRFVANIITGSDQESAFRYLAKNNNNLLRVKGLRTAFPDAIIIVPFRNPLDHSKSLHRQHLRFLEIHSTDSFSLQYMNWLGHFEFGSNFKPFKFSREVLPKDSDEPRTLDYWLRYWKCVYEYVINHHSSEVIFFDYDKFCSQPDSVLEKLGHELSFDPALIKPFSAKVKTATKYVCHEEEKRLPEPIKNVHYTLKKLSI